MQTQKKPPTEATVESKYKKIDTSIIPQHYFGVHYKPYKIQPQMKEMGMITNWFKRNPPTNKKTITALFDAATNGQCIMPANYELDEENRLRFVSSSLITIDVDDNNQATNPTDVLNALEGCCGLFYTFSHGIKGNRYRLVFQLDRPIINDEELYSAVVSELIDEIVKDMPKLNGVIDRQVKSPTQVARTGVQGAIVKDFTRTIEAQKYIELVNQERISRAIRRKENFDESQKQSIPFSELERAAHAVGYIPSGIGDGRWKSIVMAIKSYAESGFITDEQGYDLYAIISGEEASTKVWGGFKPKGLASIGTFIHHAEQNGFKFSYYGGRTSDAESLERYKGLKIESKSFASYIESDYMKELLEQEKRFLVKADTGSGKTRSTITAMKELAKELANDNVSRFYILTVPTIAITDQVEKDFNVMSVSGEIENLFSKMKAYVEKGNRVFVATYDMANTVATILRSMRPGSGISLAIDEVHQLTSNYDYRRVAIDKLHELSRSVRSLIGLTGTPDDVFRDIFEHEIHIKTHTKKPFKAPCQVFGAVTYKESKDEEPKLLQLLQQKVQVGKKLLVFIQHKDMIKRLAENLRNRSVQTATVTADGKKNNSAYKSIVDESRFPDGVQVILTTSVLSDGINILNEQGEKYECIVVASRTSELFNVDQARQMANRFRNLYEQFIIYMQAPKKENDGLFDIEKAYRLELHYAERGKAMLDEEYEGNGLLFVRDIAEHRYEFTTDKTGVFTYNKLQIRHDTAKAKEKYYSIYRAQFIKALERLLGMKSSGMIDIDEALKDVDLSDIEAELQRMKEVEKLERDMKAANIGNVYTPRVYEVLQKDDTDNQVEKTLLQAFKAATISEHFSCLKDLVSIVDYETSRQVVQRVTNRTNINAFKHRIEALAHIGYYEAIARTNITKKVYTEILQHVGGTYTKDEQKQIVSSVAKKVKAAKQSDVQRIFNTFFTHVPIRNNKERFVQLELLTIGTVVNEYGVDGECVHAAIIKYAENQPKVFKQVIERKGDISSLVLL